MSRPVFNWRPAPGASRKMKPAVQPTKFGDGYELRVSPGINSNPRAWSLSFTSPVDITPIDDFLEDRDAVESFTWTDPRGYTGVWVCREWDMKHVSGDVYSISASFEEVFE